MLSKSEMEVLMKREDNVAKVANDLIAVLWGIRYEVEHGRTPLAEDIALFKQIDHKLSAELGRLRRAVADIESQCD